jgi:hypothetical protein
VLKVNFKNIRRAPEKIDRGEFVIQDTVLREDIDLGQELDKCFSPGQVVEMSMTFHRTTFLEDSIFCPACGSDLIDRRGEGHGVW